jgi:hypothetical protein
LPFSSKKRKKASGAFEKKLLRGLKKHLSHDFPNPKRIGCPTNRLLKLLSVQPTHAEKWIVDHLLCCSPCYLTYSRILRKQKAKGFTNLALRRKQKKLRRP